MSFLYEFVNIHYSFHCFLFIILEKSDSFTLAIPLKATSPSKKETLLTSAVDALTKDQDPSLLNSYAHAHTLFLRADARLEMKPPNVDGAINDARMSVKINPTCRKAWRVLASAEEAGGDLKSAMEAVSEWAKVDPAFASKAKKEIQRLSSML